MAAASSSSSGGSWEYDVFINFRGEDTRSGFVSHLNKDLKRKALNTFIDSEKLRKGDDLSELLNAIQGSRLSLLVFSENYASSTWCLKELVQILKCMDTQNQIVVPIFYKVDPSNIRKLKASFGEALAKHERDSAADMEEMQTWRSALTRASNLSGWNSPNYRDDAKLIDDIVEDIFNKLSHISAIRDDGLVGMDSHINEMEMLLCPGVADVLFVGIWGMGGIGKTTIATAVYNKIDGQFEHCCFLENIKERFRATNGDIHTQEELLSRMLKEKRQILGTLDKGLNMIREKLGMKKVLLVLDDVDNLDQIETLIGKKPSFGGGSRIIITTRDKHLLGGFQIYKPELLSDGEALELFRQYAFRTNEPSLSYSHLSRRAIKCAHGLPLALKVLGAFLHNKSPREWEDQLEKIKRIQDPGIQGVLRISFDGLDDSQKSIFLDIACFFRGKHKDFVTKFLDSCGFFPHSGLGVLVDRALITISPYGGTLDMHDLLQEMGWAIGRLSRVWSYEDVDRMLSQNVAREAVEGIVLDLKKSKEVYVNAEAFVSMPKLRLLKLDHNRYSTDRYNDKFLLWDNSHHRALDEECKQYVSGELKFLSHELRLLIWHGSPLKYLPANFHPKNLVYLDMPHCHLEQLWEGTKPLKNLEYINLSYSQYLRKLPDLTEATNLKKVILEGCISLLEVHPSISALKHLVCLNLKGCKKLKSLPSSIHMNSLKLLDLSGCSNLEEFPDISEVMNELFSLNLDETAIKELPSSINNLRRLQTLRLGGCRELRSLPSSIHLKSLQELDLSGCSNLEEFPEISGDMNELSRLNLDETAIKELPSSIEFLQGLQTLTMRNCISLVCLPDNICKLACLKELYLDGCSKLSNLPENLGDLKHLSQLQVEGSGIQQLPFSILRLSKLESCSFDGCKEMTAPFSSWPTWIQENPSYSVLFDLDLSDCNLLELSDAIAHLSSLESLKLCRNNKLESLPAAMNRLLRLTDLYLEGCKRLKSIPELSSSIQFIDAHDCTTLKMVSTPKPPRFINCFLFYNCFQLVQTNIFTDIVENATDNQASYPARLFVSLPAGSDIPDWFDHQGRGSSVTVQLPQNWFPDKFLGLAICAISNLRGADNIRTLRYALCHCTFKANDGEKSFYFPLVHERGRTDCLFESDHMLMGYKTCFLSPREWHNEGKYTEARFRIVNNEDYGEYGVIPNDSMTLKDCTWITSCGVRLFHFNSETMGFCDLERSKRKRETLERERERDDGGGDAGRGGRGGRVLRRSHMLLLLIDWVHYFIEKETKRKRKRGRGCHRSHRIGDTGSGCLGGRETPHIIPLGIQQSTLNTSTTFPS